MQRLFWLLSFLVFLVLAPNMSNHNLINRLLMQQPFLVSTLSNILQTILTSSIGSLCVPAAAVGLLIGSAVMSKFKLSPRKVLQACFLISFVTIFAHVAILWYCDDYPFAGYNAPYPGQKFVQTPMYISSCSLYIYAVIFNLNRNLYVEMIVVALVTFSNQYVVKIN